MKEIATKLAEAVPQECPDCGKDLTALADWAVLDKLLDLLVRRIEENERG